MTVPPLLRAARSDDFAAIHHLNAGAVPAVSDVPVTELQRLADLGSCTVVDLAGRIGGFLLLLGPGADYDSVNYTWFADRHADFAYVDRVVVAPEGRGRGHGRALYEAAIASTSAPVLCAEVNIRPRNVASLAFHEVLGFRPVGEQDTDAGAKRVVLLERRLA